MKGPIFNIGSLPLSKEVLRSVGTSDLLQSSPNLLATTLLNILRTAKLQLKALKPISTQNKKNLHVLENLSENCLIFTVICAWVEGSSQVG